MEDEGVEVYCEKCYAEYNLKTICIGNHNTKTSEEDE